MGKAGEKKTEKSDEAWYSSELSKERLTHAGLYGLTSVYQSVHVND